MQTRLLSISHDQYYIVRYIVWYIQKCCILFQTEANFAVFFPFNLYTYYRLLIEVSFEIGITTQKKLLLNILKCSRMFCKTNFFGSSPSFIKSSFCLKAFEFTVVTLRERERERERKKIDRRKGTKKKKRKKKKCVRSLNSYLVGPCNGRRTEEIRNYVSPNYTKWRWIYRVYIFNFICI